MNVPPRGTAEPKEHAALTRALREATDRAAAKRDNLPPTNEAQRLAHLNAQIDDIAKLLERERGGKGLYRSAIAASDVRRLIQARRMRDSCFPAGVFDDPAWEMMLDLYAAHLENGRVSVSSLCIASTAAPTTALRWISKLTSLDLLQREPDPFDRRRAFVSLTPKALHAIERYLALTKGYDLRFA